MSVVDMMKGVHRMVVRVRVMILAPAFGALCAEVSA
jgi:hypothetical protein